MGGNRQIEFLGGAPNPSACLVGCLGELVRAVLDRVTTPDRLPDAYRKVVQMYDIHGQGVDEVSSALNRSAGAVYMLQARAHDRLRGILGATTNFFSDSA